jgi:hypothetical protein
MNHILRAIDELKMDMKKMVLSQVSAIPLDPQPHFDEDTPSYAMEGRCLCHRNEAVKPDLCVVVVSGDGDLFR